MFEVEIRDSIAQILRNAMDEESPVRDPYYWADQVLTSLEWWAQRIMEVEEARADLGMFGQLSAVVQHSDGTTEERNEL